MWIKEKFSREYHVVCNGKTDRPSEKGLLTKKDTKSRIEVFASETQDFQKWLIPRSDAIFDF